jgi:hypothetical protein
VSNRWAVLGVLILACGEEGRPGPPYISGDDDDTSSDGDADTDSDGDTDADADSDADADGDGDGDADADADADGDADLDPTACVKDADCMLAVQLDLCCACPRAVSDAYEAAEECFVAYPVQGVPPVGCARECRDCAECVTPAGATCVRGSCAPSFPGECVTREDCLPEEICAVSAGHASCEPDPNLCVQHADCDPESWCVATDDGLQRCRRLPPGGCAWDGNCSESDWCEGATDEVPGTCLPRGDGGL